MIQSISQKDQQYKPEQNPVHSRTWCIDEVIGENEGDWDGGHVEDAGIESREEGKDDGWAYEEPEKDLVVVADVDLAELEYTEHVDAGDYYQKEYVEADDEVWTAVIEGKGIIIQVAGKNIPGFPGVHIE